MFAQPAEEREAGQVCQHEELSLTGIALSLRNIRSVGLGSYFDKSFAK